MDLFDTLTFAEILGRTTFLGILSLTVLKGRVRVSHISETPASRIGKKRAYFGLGSSTLETCVEHTKWEKCESNLGGAVEPSLTVDSPLESDCESVAIKKLGSGSAR
jgi:hypothetical protein